MRKQSFFARLCFLLIAVSTAMTLRADDTAVTAHLKKALEAKIREIQIESITPIPLLGLYEVVHNDGILYIDKKVSVIIEGQLIDTKTMSNITEKRQTQLEQALLKKLPFNNAIKMVHGDGKRILITFEDPNCGYCKRLAKNLRELDNVTIYTFIIPILAQDSLVKMQQIWCAADRNQAWFHYMAEDKVLMGKIDCDVPVDENRRLAQKMRIDSVPALFFPDGSQLRGMLSTEQLDTLLDQTSEP